MKGVRGNETRKNGGTGKSESTVIGTKATDVSEVEEIGMRGGGLTTNHGLGMGVMSSCSGRAANWRWPVTRLNYS